MAIPTDRRLAATRPSGVWRAVQLVATAVIVTACTPDQGLNPFSADSVAVTTGDFDFVAEPLLRMDVVHDQYEGLISTPTWNPDYLAVDALKVETLFLGNLDSETGEFSGGLDEMLLHDVIMVASGTRGLGLQQYNGFDADDQIVGDEDARHNLDEYLSRGRRILLTDWSYDMMEATWPEYIDFVGDDAVFDDAQRGQRGTVIADVVNEDLAIAFGSEEAPVNTTAIDFNYTNFALIENVSSEVTVWMRGDVEYRKSDSEGDVALSDVPLLVSFNPMGNQDALVIYASFHLSAQTEGIVDDILRTVVGEFEKKAVAGAQIQ